MRLCISTAAALLIYAASASVQADLYWDANDSGDGGSNSDTAAGTWGIDNFWSASALGDVSTGSWVADETAAFSAGTDVTGASAVALNSTQSVAGLRFEEGTVTISGGTELLFNALSATIEAAAGASGIISSAVNSFGDIVKTGDGSVTLSGNNANLFGIITVNDGILIANTGVTATPNPNALGDTFSGTTVFDGGSLQVTGNGGSSAESITISGNGSTGSNGALRKTGGGTTTLSGGVTLNAPSRILSAQGTLTLSGTALNMNGNDVTFAGTATGTTGNITVSTTVNGSNMLTKTGQGILTLSGNNIGTFSGRIRVEGGTLSWSSDNGFTNHLGTNTFVSSDPASVDYIRDYVVLDGGTLRMTTADTSGTALMRQGRGISLGPGGGTIEMSSTAAGAKAVYNGAIRLTTGTTEATLTKTGPGEFRYQGSATTAGPSFSEFTQLVLKGGLFRAGSQLPNNYETVLGAVPATLDPDNIVFDGGQFASSFNMTNPTTPPGAPQLAWNANRGVQFLGDGTFLGTSGIEINILGPVSGSGKIIVGVDTGAFVSGNVRLSNNTNVTNFTGSVAANNGTLILNQSLNATNFSGTPLGATGAGDVNINGGGVVFTVGSDGTSTSYAGGLLGSGQFKKIGSGTLSLNSNGTANKIQLTRTSNNAFVIDGGTVAFTTAGAGFHEDLVTPGNNTAARMPVTINAGGTFDMSQVAGQTYKFASLVSTSGTTGLLTTGNNSIVLAQDAATARTYSGTIISNAGASLTKSGNAATPFTQTLVGDNTLGAVNVNVGRLNFNGTNTTGAVTVASGGTLGGGGSVSGDVTVNSGGHVAPGNSAGILTVGSASLLDGSILDIEIGGTTFPTDFDRLASAGAISLDGTLNVTLIDGYTPANNDSVHIVTAGGGILGTFDTVNLPTLPGVTWDLDYNPNSVALTAIVAATNDADFNGDGIIDSADYVVWRKFNPATGTGTQGTGDANGDTNVNDTDYDIWVQTFGNPSPGAGGGNGGGVPEPSTFAMLMIGIAALAGRRRG